MSGNSEVRFVDLAGQYRGLSEELLPAISRVLESGVYVLGAEVEDFERNFAQLCGTRHAVGVANGSDALVLSFRALDIGAGDEVITVPNSFVASAWTIVAAGATPVFVDAGKDFNMDPSKIEAAITSRTKAILPVHLTGRPSAMKEICKIAEKHNLVIVEDAAQAAGARYYGRAVGSFGAANCFSLHPLKTLNACGDGGVITTDRADVYERLMLLRNHGLKTREECVLWGFNSRLDPLQAAIVNVKLRHLARWNERIRDIAGRYRSKLRGVVEVPDEFEHEYSVYHTYVIQTDARDRLQEYLRTQGISCNIHYPIPIHLQPCANSLGYKRGDFPVVERQAARILSLPIYPELRDEQVAYVIDRIQSFFS